MQRSAHFYLSCPMCTKYRLGCCASDKGEGEQETASCGAAPANKISRNQRWTLFASFGARERASERGVLSTELELARLGG